MSCLSYSYSSGRLIHYLGRTLIIPRFHFFPFHLSNTIPKILPFVGRLDGFQTSSFFASYIFAIFDLA